MDNRVFNAMLSHTLKSGQGLSPGWQQMSGATGFADVAGSAPYLLNFVQINDFANAAERSWPLRYDYNFAAPGLPLCPAACKAATAGLA